MPVLNPFLPPAPPDLPAEHTRPHRVECGPRFHHACLELSQSFWLRGKPAPAILQLNKAAFVPSSPASYPALVWFLINRPNDRFLGNPVRHFQHLASRMSGEHAELRSWRAWACFHLAESSLPSDDFPPDQKQIEEEALFIPSLDEVAKNLPPCDASSLSEAQALAKNPPKQRP